MQGPTLRRPILPFMDFSGGLNIETSNEKLKDNEMTILQNADLSSRGSVKRRTGRTKIGSIPGTGQGLFFYYRSGVVEPDLIAAISGKLYVKPYGSSTFTQIAITDNGSPFTFQTDLPIEAVQYRQVLFVATGTKLVEMNYASGTYTANTISAYKPTTLEAINLGTNAIADSPSTWIQDTTNNVVQITGVVPSQPQGTANQPTTFTAHIAKPAKVDVHYTIGYRPTGAGTYTNVLTDSPNNYTDITFTDVGGFDIQVQTKKVTYDVQNCDTNWTACQSPFLIQAGNNLDGVNGLTPALIVKGGGTGTADMTQNLVWYDFPSPLDMSKADTLTWWWTEFSSHLSSGTDPGFVELRLYTQGNLTTPLVKFPNKNWFSGRGIGGGWNSQTDTYDPSLAGMDKIVRIAYKGYSQPGTYIPNTGFQPSSSDTTTRLDNIQMYMSGTEVTYVKENYQVVGVQDPMTDPSTYSAIHTSRMIRLHWDRILLGKDNQYPGQIYISDLNNPRYFPMNKRIDFSLDRQEPITAVVRYQSFLVIFTRTTISTLTGTHPQDTATAIGEEYKVSLINDTIGCVADKTAKVVGNNIAFLSSDGLHSLVPNPYQLQNLEPQKIDFPVKSEMIIDENACSIVHDEQYYICFPSQNKIIRYYYNQAAWVKDTSSKLNLEQFAYYNGEVYNLTQDGNIYLQDPSVYSDDGEIYDMVVQSKYIDLQAVFNYKKLKRLFVMARYYNDHTVNLYNRVWADGAQVIDPTTGGMTIEDGVVKWVSTTAPNMHLYGSTLFGSWLMGEAMFGESSIFINEMQVRGKCRRVRVSFTHSQDTPCEILGFGVEFKYKAPGKMVST